MPTNGNDFMKNIFCVLFLTLVVFSEPSTTSSPSVELKATSEDLWEKPYDGLEVFTSKGIISSEKVITLCTQNSMGIVSL